MARLITHRLIWAMLLAALALLVTDAPAQAAFPGANGKIAFASGDLPTQEIYTVNPDGSALTRLTNNTWNDGVPAWSPSGTKIAFSTNRDQGNYEIYTMNADGTGQTRLTHSEGFNQWPAWSPDGTKIAFERRGDIYTMNADGSAVTRVTGGASNPAWSPDGTKIAFSGDGGPSIDLFTVKPDGSDVTNLTNSPTFDSQPNWSPDGSKLAFSAYSGGDLMPDVYTMNADGSGQVDITNDAANQEFAPAWSPDGRKIVFGKASASGDVQQIYLMNADGGGVTLLPGSGGGGKPDWQPIIPRYPRPKGATPLRVSLVPAYTACTSPNMTHGAPLSYGSCSPPSQASSYLTVGTLDANGQADRSVGSVTLKTIPGDPATTTDEADVRIDTSITDVRRKTDLADYAGELASVLQVRLTDRLSGGQTVEDFPLNVTVPCNVTADTTIGSSCSLATTADTVLPGAVPESERSIWALDKVDVYDGGADGLVSTTTGNTLFETQGVSVP